MRTAEKLISSAYELQLGRRASPSTDRNISRFLALMAPTVTFRFEDGTVSRGRHELRQHIVGITGQWASVRYELGGIEELDDGQFKATGEVLVRARDGDAEESVPFSNLWTVRAGRAAAIEAEDGPKGALPRSGLLDGGGDTSPGRSRFALAQAGVKR